MSKPKRAKLVEDDRYGWLIDALREDDLSEKVPERQRLEGFAGLRRHSKEGLLRRRTDASRSNMVAWYDYAWPGHRETAPPTALEDNIWPAEFPYQIRLSRDGVLCFLTRWQAWHPQHDTWEPESSFSGLVESHGIKDPFRVVMDYLVVQYLLSSSVKTRRPARAQLIDPFSIIPHNPLQFLHTLQMHGSDLLPKGKNVLTAALFTVGGLKNGNPPNEVKVFLDDRELVAGLQAQVITEWEWPEGATNWREWWTRFWQTVNRRQPYQLGDAETISEPEAIFPLVRQPRRIHRQGCGGLGAVGRSVWRKSGLRVTAHVQRPHTPKASDMSSESVVSDRGTAAGSQATSEGLEWPSRPELVSEGQSESSATRFEEQQAGWDECPVDVEGRWIGVIESDLPTVLRRLWLPPWVFGEQWAELARFGALLSPSHSTMVALVPDKIQRISHDGLAAFITFRPYYGQDRPDDTWISLNLISQLYPFLLRDFYIRQSLKTVMSKQCVELWMIVPAVMIRNPENCEVQGCYRLGEPLEPCVLSAKKWIENDALKVSIDTCPTATAGNLAERKWDALVLRGEDEDLKDVISFIFDHLSTMERSLVGTWEGDVVPQRLLHVCGGHVASGRGGFEALESTTGMRLFDAKVCVCVFLSRGDRLLFEGGEEEIVRTLMGHGFLPVNGRKDPRFSFPHFGLQNDTYGCAFETGSYLLSVPDGIATKDGFDRPMIIEEYPIHIGHILCCLVDEIALRKAKRSNILFCQLWEACLEEEKIIQRSRSCDDPGKVTFDKPSDVPGFNNVPRQVIRSFGALLDAQDALHTQLLYAMASINGPGSPSAPQTKDGFSQPFADRTIVVNPCGSKSNPELIDEMSCVECPRRDEPDSGRKDIVDKGTLERFRRVALQTALICFGGPAPIVPNPPTSMSVRINSMGTFDYLEQNGVRPIWKVVPCEKDRDEEDFRILTDEEEFSDEEQRAVAGSHKPPPGVKVTFV